ncbi:MAG: AAA family ATPase [Muribaculaceae bacterium]|nr:AAA family ATPase [Muribaculaceae bacterium]
MDNVKLAPYGISDFKQVRNEGKYFVDKSQYLPQLELSGNFLLLTRPRRFGKSIFLGMLKAYYDLMEADQWDALFGDLWIHEHPTKLRHTFLVLHFDFSQVLGGVDDLPTNFNNYCCAKLDEFAHRYAHLYPDWWLAKVLEKDRSADKIQLICGYAKQLGLQLYLIIDEYDNFTNTVMSEHGEKVYHAMTHAEGFYRDEFKLYKPNFHRILMLGVSPVTMDDLTSGFNIAANITLEERYNMMLVFSETDVRQMIRYYQSVGVIDVGEDREESLIEQMRPWYDNYCFSRRSFDTDTKMFNCDMVIYFMRSITVDRRPPEQMLDPNTKTVYNKLERLIRLDTDRNERKSVVLEVAEKGYIDSQGIVPSFPASDITHEENFVSLLYYYGMLTIGVVWGAMLKLVIPNNNVRQQYYDFLLKEYDKQAPLNMLELKTAYAHAALHGAWEPMLRELARMYKQNNSVRRLMEGERNVQGFFNALLALNPYYLCAPEVELNHGYCDFFLLPDHIRYPMVAHSYIIEVKYLRKDDPEALAVRQRAEAANQLRHYAHAPMVEQLRRDTQLHLIAMQLRNLDLVSLEQID